MAHSAAREAGQGQLRLPLEPSCGGLQGQLGDAAERLHAEADQAAAPLIN